MAFNRFKMHAIRSTAHPGGLPNLSSKKRHMVEVGNLLFHIGISLLKAQEAMGLLWTWEQPASSLQLQYKPLAEAFAAFAVCWAVSHLCAYGAPRVKPTAVISKALLVQAMCKRFPGCLDSIRIEGKAPCGNNWSKIASAYWPEWAKQLNRTLPTSVVNAAARSNGEAAEPFRQRPSRAGRTTASLRAMSGNRRRAQRSWRRRSTSWRRR